MKAFSPVILLLSMFLANTTATAQNESPFDGLSVISESDIRNSAIDFVNTTSSPGLEGATLNVDNAVRHSNQWRSSLGFNAEITLKDYIFNAYWGLGLVGGSLNDRLLLTADNGQPVTLDLRRDVISLRASLGLVLPVNEHFKLRPVLTFAVSDMQTKSTIDGLDINNNSVQASFRNGAQLASTTGSLDALYWYWKNDYKLELSAHYNLIYTDSFSDDNPLLDFNSWSQTAQLKTRISGPTSLDMLARPWRWIAYANHTNFLTQTNTSLGYTRLFEIGTGLEWQINMKPLNWFGWQYIGFSAGVITSTNVEGFNVGLTAR
jgi:hypothetical protein